MTGIARSFAQPDDTTTFPNGSEDVIELSGVPVGSATFQPGWRWSNDIRPITGTERCPIHHVGYALSGHLHVELADGGTLDLREGELFDIPPGHDAWVVGDAAVRLLDWGGKAKEYARPAGGTR